MRRNNSASGRSLVFLGVVAYFVALALFASACSSNDSKQVSVTIQTVDESNVPVGNAEVQISFNNRNGEFDTKRGVSDRDGYFSHRALAFSRIYVKAQSEGHYFYEKDIKPYRMSGELAVLENGEPIYEDKEEKLIIKRIKNPVPLYAYANWQLRIPGRDKPFGYDIIRGDWVAPHGKGQSVDIYFSYSCEYRGMDDYRGKLEMTFPGERDGLREFPMDYGNGSYLKSDYLAPESGYKPTKAWEFQRKPSVILSNTGDRKGNFKDYNKKMGYWLRLRTLVDESGNIQEAVYAKIYQDINYGGVIDGSFIKFSSVYVNPEANDRNLEFNLDRNLFSLSKIENQPRYP